jgi:uncharacterized protein YcfJ
MKQSLLLGALGLAATGALAQEVGMVISSTPVIQQVAVPRQVCNQAVVTTQAPPSGAGALLGALAGAGVGSLIGSGSGNIAAIGLGTVIGAGVGNSVEGPRQQQAVVPNCTTETSYENRTVAWNVEYEYAGRRYTTQMPYDPGRTIQLQVTPVSSGAAPAGVVTAPSVQSQGGVVTAPPVQAAPGYVQPAPTYVQPLPAPVVVPAPMVVQSYSTYPAYPPVVYGGYAPYWPVGISLGFNWSSGHHHHRPYRRWR